MATLAPILLLNRREPIKHPFARNCKTGFHGFPLVSTVLSSNWMRGKVCPSPAGTARRTVRAPQCGASFEELGHAP